MNEENKSCHGHGQKKRRSSFQMQDPEIVFDALALKEGESFLDLGCGPGDYSIRAAKQVDVSGTVYALDASESMIEALKKEAAYLGIKNIRPMVADITEPLPLADNQADVCLIATVLHIPPVTRNMGKVITEVRRILRPSGRFAVIECSKKDLSFGPPEYMRLSAEEIEEAVMPQGFEKIKLTDLGFNYYIEFAVK
ncbi:class I SAM-dependent methyltransferase [Desulfonema magnum]|uniref:class I SAM-dependent methyltransferase n=1 Tax=Desulfonema magnum TaxID=45655 RepID=UPI001A9B0B98|nr:methyltransferase domain-containing protein [Desulfonema magnum]